MRVLGVLALLVLAACGEAAEEATDDPQDEEEVAGDDSDQADDSQETEDEDAADDSQETEGETAAPDELNAHLPNPGSVTEAIFRNLINQGIEPNFDGDVRPISHQAGTNDAFAAVLSEPDVAEGTHFSVITNHSVIASVSGSAPFDFEDLQGLATFATTPMVVAVPADAPWETLEDLAADAQDDASAIRVSIGAASGSIHHLTAIRLQESLDANGDFSIIPHTDAGEGTLTLLGGGAEVGVGTPAGYIDQVELGELRFLAVLGEERHIQLPDEPTAIEQGVDLAMENQFRVVTSSEVSPERVAWFSELLEAAITEPDFIASVEEIGWSPVHRSAEETQADFDEWADFTRDILEDLGL